MCRAAFAGQRQGVIYLTAAMPMTVRASSCGRDKVAITVDNICDFGTNRSNCHVDAKCGFPRLQLHAAEAQFADAYSGRRGLAADRQDAGRARRPQGPGRAGGRKIRPGLSHPSVRRDQPHAARARSQRAGAVRPGQAVLLDAWLGPDSRPAVSARPDAARFRGTSPAPARAVGRLQVRADEILSRRISTPGSRRGSRNGRRSRDRCCSIPR